MLHPAAALANMRIIPVIDLQQGQVVRGVAGRRSEYRPLESTLCNSAEPGEIAAALARAGFDEVYVADLDAIEGGPPQTAAHTAIAAAGLELWLDAGPRNSEQLRSWLDDGSATHVRRWIVGLESVAARDELQRMVTMIGSDQAVFSLDLQAGQPRCAPPLAGQSPWAWAQAAYAAGFRRLIVLDLCDVGMGGGTSTLQLCRRIRDALPEVELIAGGGVRNRDDLQQLGAAGCNAALVASALHDGRL